MDIDMQTDANIMNRGTTDTAPIVFELAHNIHLLTGGKHAKRKYENNVSFQTNHYFEKRFTCKESLTKPCVNLT